MSALICSFCSHIFESDGPLPDQCPKCGRTFDNNNDVTQTADAVISTIVLPSAARRTMIGRYVVISELGRGGFGSVLLAKDPRLDRLVAIKVPRRDTGINPESLERFAREAQSAAQLRHPGIVAVHDVEHDGRLPFIVCEYVEGRPLNEQMRRQPYGFREAAQLVAAVASAVDYAHAKGIIHRDIKPSNILIDVDGKPRLADFGMAKRESIHETVTADHRILGTPAYMSPEQAWGKQSSVDRRTDVYSLGTVLYQLLTEELPFHGEPRMVMRQVIEEEPPKPRTLKAEIPLDLETICLKAIEKESSKRYQTAGELAADLGRWLRSEPIHARPVTRLERYWRWCRRNPVTAGLVAAIALVLVVSACGGVILAASEREQTNAARHEKAAALVANKEEHDARTLAEQRLRERDAALLENRRLLSKAYVERANRNLDPQGSLSDYRPINALPWLYAAMELDENDPQRRDASRIRLGSALRSLPSVEKVWFHGGPISSAAISPSGDRFFTGGEDGTCRLWDFSKDEPVAPPLIHPEPVRCGTFNPDGSLLLTGCADGGARIWQVPSGKLIAGPFWDSRFNRQVGSASNMTAAFSDDGQSFVTVRSNTVIQTWDTATRRPLAVLSTSDKAVRRAIFAHHGTRLATGLFDGSISIWNVQTGMIVHRLESSSRMPALAAVSSDGTMIAGTTGPQTVVFWEGASGKQIATPPLGHAEAITNLAFSRDGRFLASGTKDGTVYLWKVPDGRLIWTRQLSLASVGSLQFASQAPELAVELHMDTMSDARRLCLLDVEGGNLIAEPIVVPSDLRFFQFLGQPGLLAAAEGNGLVRLWRTERTDSAFLSPLPAVRCAAVSEDRRVAALIGRGAAWSIFRSTGDKDFEPATASIQAEGISKANLAVLAPDNKRLALADQKSSTWICDSSTGTVLARLDCGAQVVRMAFSAKGDSLVTVTKDGRIGSWNPTTGERLRYERLRVNGTVDDVSLEPTLGLCAVAAGREIVVWNVAKATTIGSPLSHSRRLQACRFSADGRLILSACMDQYARIWEVSSGRILAATTKLPDQIRAIAFSPNSERFATGSSGGTARIWRVTDAKPLTPPLQHSAHVTGCMFSPDGRWLVTTSGDLRRLQSRHDSAEEPIIRVWDASTGEPILVRALQRLAGRFPIPPSQEQADPFYLLATFFSADTRRLHAITTGGLLITIDGTADHRPTNELLRDVILRSGTCADPSGGLSLIDPDQLVSFRRTLSSHQ